MTIDEAIYVAAASSAKDMRKEMIAPKNPRGVFMRYWNLTAPRTRPAFTCDPYETADNIWIGAAIGISQYMVETLIEFAKKHGIDYEAA